MKIAKVEVTYNGRGWYATLETDPAGHSLGVSPLRRSRVAVAGPGAPLDVDTALWLREGLVDLVYELVSHLASDVIDGAHDEPPALFDPLP